MSARHAAVCDLACCEEARDVICSSRDDKLQELVASEASLRKLEARTREDTSDLIRIYFLKVRTKAVSVWSS